MQKIKPKGLPSDQNSTGRSLGREELINLAHVIESGALISNRGTFVKAFENEFANLLGVPFAYACSSGTAAIHTAVAAINPSPGDEIITSSITDMGAISPILYQGAIPVFADVDASTGNLTVATITARLSHKTKAIIVTHLFGNPCDMPAIMALARAHNFLVIEDCAQAFFAKTQDQYVGVWGDLACFSLQQGKHITAGEGGIVTTQSSVMSRRANLFINKAWGYGDEQPDHYFLALNYRMNELTGAVALAQLQKLPQALLHRQQMAKLLCERLKNISGISVVSANDGGEHVYWRFAILVDEQKIKGGAFELGALLNASGIPCSPRYIQKPAFECEVIKLQRTFGESNYPFNLASIEAVNYSKSLYSGTYYFLDHVIVFGFNEKYQSDDIFMIANRVAYLVNQLAV